jgi:methyltransferase (TIGR00027 family)
MARRIESRPSLTAELTCICRSGSSVEKNLFYKSEDAIALQILTEPIKTLIQHSFYRKLHFGLGAPHGLYEYIIIRTKYIDAIFKTAIENKINQVLILGAGYDTRAIRLPNNRNKVKIYEFDSVFTQQSKIKMFTTNDIQIPENLIFIPINFEKEKLSNKLLEIGVKRNQRSLYIIEGVTMYLEPSAIDVLFTEISKYMGKDSIVVFDYIYNDVIRQEKKHYGETEAIATVKKANESFQFGIEKGSITNYLLKYNLQVIDHLDAREMERRYFTDNKGKIIHQVNDIHCLVTAQKV